MTALHWRDCHWFCRHSFSSPVRNGSLFLFGESPSPLTSRLQCEPAHFGESYVLLVETPWQYPTINPNLDIAVSPSELRWSPDIKSLWQILGNWILGLGIFWSLLIQCHLCYLGSDTVPTMFWNQSEQQQKYWTLPSQHKALVFHFAGESNQDLLQV